MLPRSTNPGFSSSPMMAFAMVDLPAPDSPTTAWISPGAMLSDTSSTATKDSSSSRG
jgi:hypothetical protein